MIGRALIAIALATFVTGCTRDRSKTACEWSEGANASLRQDVQSAEDAAIRYADTNFGRAAGAVAGNPDYGRARQECTSKLFTQIAAARGVSPEQIMTALRQRPVMFDWAVILSFAAIYCVASAPIAVRIWRRFPPAEGWTEGLIAALLISIGVSGLAVLVGEAWSLTWETVRIGNGHLSNRADRIPWAHHQLALFFAGLALFWIAAAVSRRKTRARPTGFDRLPI